ncbi:MAG: capsular biosynthesis protein [Bacteroidaceae bacterium]|nr:capsular biosynthesis protein [Bacteroidaceae bacterium]
MWPFSKKATIAQIKLLADGTDYHSHILPGVDDGISSMDEALQALQSFSAMGIKELWLTPHIMEDFPNTPASLQMRYEALLNEYKGPIALHLAAEYMIDNLFDELLDTGHLLPIGEGGNHLLVETSYFTPPIHLEDTLQRIKSKGYYPLLAHPERYIYMDNDEYRTLHNNGTKMQLNIPSLAGVYGRTAQKKAMWLLKNNMYTVAGSDLHSVDALEIINSIPLDKNTHGMMLKLLHINI